MVVNEITKLKYEQITFFSIFKEYGFLRFLISTETFLSICVLLILFNYKILPLPSEKENYILPVLLSVSASIFAVEIAGFAVIATLSDKSFLAFLWKKQTITKILFPFIWCGLFWVITILVGIIQYMVNLSDYDFIYKTQMQFISVFLFIYSLLLTYRLLLIVFRFSVIGAYYFFKRDNEKDA